MLGLAPRRALSRGGMTMLTPEQIEAICQELLGSWTKRLVGEHSTPVLLLGAGHDDKSGQLVICTTEEMSNDEIMDFLAGALYMMNR